MSNPKRRIRQNVYGNWKGYEGRKRAEDFGTDESEANRWLRGEPKAPPEPLIMIDWKARWAAAEESDRRASSMLFETREFDESV
jgi:hypothetical protein